MFNIIPSWPAPKNISALTTTRQGGVSQRPYDNNNFGLHVGDNVDHVLSNRADLVAALELPAMPEWLEQTHSTHCVVVEEDTNRHADAAITRSKESVLAVMTADCQPILLCNRQGTEIAAIHAGWRGLADGIIENTVSKMQSPPQDLLVWIGPAMCGFCFEVGGEVRARYLERYPFTDKYFVPHHDKWLADLPHFTEHLLNELSISAVYQAQKCTFEQKKDFFSYRRDKQTGRMATLIWFNQKSY